MATNKKIEAQRAYVAQCEAALQHYVAEGKAGRSANYGNLSGLIRTAQDVVHVQTGKLMQMEREAEDGPSYSDIMERWNLDANNGAED